MMDCAESSTTLSSPGGRRAQHRVQAPPKVLPQPPRCLWCPIAPWQPPSPLTYQETPDFVGPPLDAHHEHAGDGQGGEAVPLQQALAGPACRAETPDGDQSGKESPPRVPEAAGHTTRTSTHLQILSTTPVGFMAPPATEQALRSSADGAERCKAQLSPPGAEHLRTALCLGLCSSGFGAEPSTPRQEVSFLQN